MGGIDICSDGYCVKFNAVIMVLYINMLDIISMNIYTIKSNNIIIMICIQCLYIWKKLCEQWM